MPTEVVYTLGDDELFYGATVTAMDDGKELSANGDYRGAINKFKEALRHHGKPSAVLENWIAGEYKKLGQYELAITHYSNSIEINDDSVDRINRARLYLDNDQCVLAIIDARAALNLEAHFDIGIHTDVEANYILANCYFFAEEYLLSAKHMEAAYEGARLHQYAQDEVDTISEELDIILSYLTG